MSDVKLFIGGTPNPLFPNPDGRNQYREPHAHRIAYEYANGEFTLGWPLNPSEVIYQRRELEGAELEVGDHILLYVVPQEHLLTSVLARIDAVDSRFAGATIKPTAMLWDAATKTYEESDVLDALFDNLTLTEKHVAFAQLKASSVTVPAADVKAEDGTVVGRTPEQVIKTDGGYFVPTGKALVLGFKVTALPTDSTQKFSLTQAVASLVAKVSGFDIPTTV